MKTKPHAHTSLDEALGCEKCQAIARRKIKRTPLEARAETVMNHVTIGGAKSSEIKPRYDQIPACAQRREALRFSLGNRNYDGPEADVIGGPMNWQNGDATFFRERFNHVIEHLLHWKECREKGIPSDDDDLAAARWGTAILMWAEENGKLSNENPGTGTDPVGGGYGVSGD